MNTDLNRWVYNRHVPRKRKLQIIGHVIFDLCCMPYSIAHRPETLKMLFDLNTRGKFIALELEELQLELDSEGCGEQKSVLTLLEDLSHTDIKEVDFLPNLFYVVEAIVGWLSILRPMENQIMMSDDDFLLEYIRFITRVVR